MDKEIVLKEELLLKIIRLAFMAGENWGVCYQSWFTPSESDSKIKIDECIEHCLKELE